MGINWYVRDGSISTDIVDWVRLCGDDAYRRVAKTDVGDVLVSTVWLGIDHAFGGGGPPVIFETMVFGGPLDEECDRYSTEAEAIAGHEAMVARVQAVLAAAEQTAALEHEREALADAVRVLEEKEDGNATAAARYQFARGHMGVDPEWMDALIDRKLADALLAQADRDATKGDRT